MRCVLPQIGHEAGAIGVVGMDLAVLAEDQRVGSTYQRGAVGDDVGQGKHGFLVGYRDIEPDKAQFGQYLQRVFQVGLADIHRDVMTIDTVPLEPVAVQGGRTAVGDGMADDPSQGNARHIGHDGTNPLRDR